MTDRRFRRHRDLLLTAVAVLTASLLLIVLPGEERIAVRGFSDWPLPHLCLSRSLLQYACGGCGLTRCFIYMTSGEFASAWRMHPPGVLLWLMLLAQIPYRGFALWGSRECLHPAVRRSVSSGLITLLIAHWIWRIVEPWVAA